MHREIKPQHSGVKVLHLLGKARLNIIGGAAAQTVDADDYPADIPVIGYIEFAGNGQHSAGQHKFLSHGENFPPSLSEYTHISRKQPVFQPFFPKSDLLFLHFQTFPILRKPRPGGILIDNNAPEVMTHGF